MNTNLHSTLKSLCDRVLGMETIELARFGGAKAKSAVLYWCAAWRINLLSLQL